MKNPFVTNGYVSPEYFCDRVTETKKIVSLLTNGNNIALISPRRIGKTDLIRHCFEQQEIKNEYHTFIIDIYSTNSLKDFVNVFGQAIGNPEATLTEIFRYLQQADKPCLIAIDEFQQITKYPDGESVEATLRTHIQRCPNANFLFSGSQRHMMGEIFTSPARPFYQSVTIMNLQPIALEKYAEFCEHHFEEAGKHLAGDVVPCLYNRFRSTTAYMQKVMNLLFAATAKGESCMPEMIDDAITDILNLSSDTYDNLLYQIPEKQKNVLLAIAADGEARAVCSAAFVKKHRLPSASSISSAVKGLLEKDLITQNKDVYMLSDMFFQLWLNANTDE